VSTRLSRSHQQPAHANPSCTKGECRFYTENAKDTGDTENQKRTENTETETI